MLRMVENTNYNRRRALKAAAALGAVGLAGCLGDDSDDADDGDDSAPADDSDDSDDTADDGDDSNGEEYWPPDVGQVEFASPASPGSGRYVMTDNVVQHLEYPDDVDTTINSITGGGGVIQLNESFSGPTDGSHVSASTLVTSYINEIVLQDEANYSMAEFRHFAIASMNTVGIFLNPDNTDIDDHFQMDYDTFIENIPDWNIGYSSPRSQFPWLYIAEVEPSLSQDDLTIAGFDGGSEIRAAHERGDIHASVHSAISNYQGRADFYKCQFVAAYPDGGELHTRIDDAMEDPVYLAETSMEEEHAQFIADVLTDGYYFALPPGTPDEVLAVHEETFQAALGPEMEETFETNSGEGSYMPEFDAAEVDEMLTSRAESLAEEADLIRDVFS